MILLWLLQGDDQKKQLLQLSPAIKWQMIMSRRAMNEEMPPSKTVEHLNRSFAGKATPSSLPPLGLVDRKRPLWSAEGIPDANEIADLVLTIRSGSKTWLQVRWQACREHFHAWGGG
jgi:hypothetical protein